MSCAPDLVEDEKEHHGHAAPDKDDFFLPIVPDDRDIIVHVRMPIEKLMSPAPDKNPGKHKEDHGESESNAQRRNCLDTEFPRSTLLDFTPLRLRPRF